MVSTAWTRKRQPHWKRLEQLIGVASGGLTKLNHGELREFGLLYRQTAADLSTVLEDSSSAQLAHYLNDLLGRGHNLLYMGQRPRLSGIIDFYAAVYPAVFRQTLPLTALATAIFFVSATVGWVVTASDPAFAHRVLGPQMMVSIEQHEMWTHSVVAMKPVAASQITTNNLSVAFAACAGGITILGSLWLMIFNGLMLGVVGAATYAAGMALPLWSFVAPHGVLELPAIFIAGGAGFEITRGLLFPGLLPRRASLAQAGGRAVRLMLGTLPLLLIAGTIEGFFSASATPVVMKFALAAVLFSCLCVYLFGRWSTTGSGPSRADTH
ncbi:stage II sporulation protein M [uncultured Paludibaculum sp.]|uniref:stage II sporulation protein M n=1 Tax=uncultured Paludibaculum sp. TaxID=1765020 RepID=UPI002AAA6C78|nr:stage II sporulation protein M [uncultured Paludibaculum sp.]